MGARKIRRAQLIQPYGVGSLVEIEGESFVVKDLSKWAPQVLEDVELPSLKKLLRGTRRLRQPRDQEGVAIPVARFPRWLFCSRCRQMYHWRFQYDEESRGGVPRCRGKTCDGHGLTPMRWVRVCDAGHMDDIDWYFMAHAGAQSADSGQCDRSVAVMKFVTGGGRGGDFGSMRIVCECGASSNLEFIRRQRLPGRCSGCQPWQARNEAVECQQRMYAEPRGSSALHYPQTLSALAIPIDGERQDPRIAQALERLELTLQMVRQVAPTREELNGNLLEYLERQIAQQAEDAGILAGEVNAAALAKIYPVAGDSEADVQLVLPDNIQLSILESEFEALSDDRDEDGPDFSTGHTQLKDGGRGSLGHYFRKITKVRRLREVRVFRGFYRRDVGSDNELVPADLSGNCDWLNAATVIGEGLFLEFNPARVVHWESAGGTTLAQWLAPQFAAAGAGGRLAKLLLLPSARFVMMHTFAHLLLRQLAFDCGYSSSALRERVYTANSTGKVGGILIYTADSDSEGSMGGLVELGDPHTLEPIIRRAVAQSLWCSSDPVCRESAAQGLDGLNRAACHACCLLGETSCAHMNVFLDRVLLTGGQGLVEDSREPTGYFASMLADAGG